MKKIRNLFRKNKTKLFRAVYVEGFATHLRNTIDENVIGYFSSEGQFRQAVKERWPNNYKDAPIFRRHDNGELRVNFGTDGVVTSSHYIILKEIEPTGFYYGTS